MTVDRRLGTSGRVTEQVRPERRPGGLLLPDAQPITARLAAAGSRRPELEALLAAAPLYARREELRRLVIDSNVTGKSSAASRGKVWAQLSQQYVLDTTIPEYRAFLQPWYSTGSPGERGLLCFLLFARCDRLFRELSLSAISPLLSRSGTPIDPGEVDQTLENLLAGGNIVWTEETRETVRQHALSALKDFGVLVGSMTKRTERPRSAARATLFASRLSRLEGLTDRQVLNARWFKLLGLETDQVIDLLFAARREGVLEFRMQADVVELGLPPLEDGT